MSKHMQLHIPEPCHENWNKMTPVEKGRYCGSCQKQVVDFTNMKDEQLITFFKRQSTGSVCGRFMQDQLDRSIEMPKKRIPWVKYFFQFALPAFLLSKKASAQGEVFTGNIVVMPASPKNQTEKKAGGKHEKERLIRGTVVDELGGGISYATIFIKGTTIGVAADSMGNFSVKYPGQEKSIVLISSSIGFKEVETIVDLNKTDKSVTVFLPSDNTLKEVVVAAPTLIVGAIRLVVGGVSVRRRNSFIDTVWSKFSSVKQTSNVYPNPVKSNAELNIKIGKYKKGTHLFQLSSANGQVVLTKELWIEENNGIVKLSIPSLSAGAYFLQIINKQSGKRNTEKIIIE